MATHFISGGFQLISFDSRDAKTSDEFAKRINEYAEKNPGRWITGGDWDHELWGGELPRKDWIGWFIDIWGLQVHFKTCRYNTKKPKSTRRFDRER
jgi:hypothetical protein